jgi:hypothetical protein
MTSLNLKALSVPLTSRSQNYSFVNGQNIKKSVTFSPASLPLPTLRAATSVLGLAWILLFL